MSHLPPILRKHLRLHQARRALLRGAPEEALGLLGDPCLLLSSRAEWMRSRTLEMLCRAALRKARDGRDASTARLIQMVDSEDPERADRLRHRLRPPADEAEAPASRETLASMRRLLSDMRDALPSQGAPTTNGGRDEAVLGSPTAPPGRLALLAVDDGGESLLARGTEFVLGHLRSESADLPFLADIEREHARLLRVESFHGGTRWCIEANGLVEIDGVQLVDASCTLADGQEVRLAHNLSFRFRLPDPSSSTAVLELLQGAECLGAGRILLCVPGAAGRLRIGPGRDRHIGVGALDEDLELCFDQGRLVVRCAAGLRSNTTVEGAVSSEGELSLPWPLPVPVDLAVGQATAGGPPFGIALRPVAEPRPRASSGPRAGAAGPGAACPDDPGPDDPGQGETAPSDESGGSA